MGFHEFSFAVHTQVNSPFWTVGIPNIGTCLNYIYGWYRHSQMMYTQNHYPSSPKTKESRDNSQLSMEDNKKINEI